MTITVEQALTVQTAEEIEEERLAELAAEGVEEQGYGERTVPRTLITLEARAENTNQGIRATVIRAAFGDTAEPLPNAWVDRFVGGRFNEPRLPAVKAKHLVKMLLTGSVPSYNNVKPGACVVQTTDGLVQFENVDEFSIANSVIAYNVFRCRVAGVVGNVPAGSITRLAISFPGLQVLNESGSLVTVGRPEEANKAYIDRGRAKMARPAAGGSALSYVTWTHEAFAEAGVEDTITQVRVDDTNPFGPGSVGVYLANAAGAATVDELAIATPYLQARHAAGGSAELRVLAAATKTIDVAGTLYVTGNPTAITQAGVVLATYQVEAQGSTIIYLSELIARLRAISGSYDLKLTAPTGDTPLYPSEVPVFTNSLVLG